jgi:hypothetical protein
MSAKPQTTTEEPTNDDVARTLANHMQVQELRNWMSENDLSRSRGARKLESAKQAVEQDRDLCERKAAELVSDQSHSVSCSCGLWKTFGDGESAEDAAKKHKSRHPDHFPVARNDLMGEKIYG